MADSTYLWSAERSYRSSRGWRATRAWLVHGTAIQSEAEVAPPMAGTTSPPIAQINESHPSNGLLKCESVNAARDKGPMTWVVTAEYAIPDSGGFSTPDNPLQQPPEIQIDWENGSEPFDVDVDGIPVVNGSNVPFDTDPAREVFDISITVVRNEPFYPLQKAIQFAGTVNAGGYTIPEFNYSIDDGQALCMPIRVLTGYQKTSPYVTVAYTLKVRRDGWRTRIKNKSAIGYAGGKPGAFVNASGQQLGTIDIHPRGLPIRTDVSVATDQAASTPSTAEPVPTNPVPLTYFEQGTDCWFIKFKKYKSVSFAGLM